MSSLSHVRHRVQTTLRVVEPPAPCPSEPIHGAACYLAYFRDPARWCPRCLAECDGREVPGWVTAAEPCDPTLSMDGWIDAQAERVRSLGSDLGEWLAARLEALADECRDLRATTPDEFDARAEVMARTGYLEGYSGQPYPAWERSTPADEHFARVQGWTRGWYDHERDAHDESDRSSAGVGCL